MNQSEVFPTLLEYLFRYFYARDIVNTRKNEWVVMRNGESIANTFDEMPLTFKKKTDGIDWLINEKEPYEHLVVVDNKPNVVVTCCYNDFRFGDGKVSCVTLLDTDHQHHLFVQCCAERAAGSILQQFLRDDPMPDYIAKVIHHYFVCLREDAPARLSELNGANDATLPSE